MIRRKFMKFAPKEHNDEKVKKNLEKHNVPTFEGHQPTKFGQFSQVAKDLAATQRKNVVTPEGGHVASAEKTFSWQQKAIYGGGGGRAPQGSSDPRNPYAVVQPSSNPYARAQPAAGQGGGHGGQGNANPYGGGNSAYAGGSSAYGGSASSPYGATPSPGPSTQSAQSNDTYGPDSSSGYTKDTYAAQGSYDTFDSQPSRYGAGGRSDPAARPHKAEFDTPDSFGVPLARTQTGQSTTSTMAARQELFGAAPRQQRKMSALGEDDELNLTPDELARGAQDDGLSRVRPGLVPSEDDELNYPSDTFNRERNYSRYDGSNGNDEGEDYDELNEMPADLSRREAPVSDAPQYQNYGEQRQPQYDDDGFVTGEQLFSQQDSEDEDVDYVKREIRQTKQETVESSRRALQVAYEAETSGRNALGMLGNQGERLGNSAKTVQLGGVQARVADENADELMRLNRSIFIPNVSNPFNSRRRNQMKAARLQGQQVYDRLEQEELERLQRESESRVSQGLNGSGAGYSETALRARQRMNRDNPERKMYQFEADSDDDALEDELDQNLDEIQHASRRLHQLSLNINGEVNSQNRRIEEMGGRVDDLDHRLHKSTAKMATIN